LAGGNAVRHISNRHRDDHERLGYAGDLSRHSDLMTCASIYPKPACSAFPPAGAQLHRKASLRLRSRPCSESCIAYQWSGEVLARTARHRWDPLTTPNQGFFLPFGGFSLSL
jgi:hypothetical protein